MRARRIAWALGTLSAVSLLAHAGRADAKRLVVMPHDVAPPAFQLDGLALGGRQAPQGIETALAAQLAGSAIAAVGDGALVIDADSGELVKVDARGKALARLPIGPGATQLVYDAQAGRAYVAARGKDEILAVEVGATQLTIAKRWPTPTEPYGVALAPDHQTLVVTTVAARTLVAFDVATGEERWRRPLAPDPRGVAISPDGKKAVVASLTSGAVERIDLADPTRTTAVSLGAVPAAGFAPVLGQLAPAVETGRRLSRSAFAARFVGNDLAMVAHQTSVPLQDARFGGENTGSYGGGFESPITHHVTFIAAGERAPRTAVAQIAEHQPKAIAWDPVRDRAFIAGYGSDTITVLAAASQSGVRLDRTIAIGGTEACGPDGLAVAADGTAWVFCAVSRRTVRITMDQPTSTALIGVAAVAPTRMTKIQHEGFDLFRRGNDGRISSRGAMACSSCHPEAGTDGLSWRIEQHELQTPYLAGRVAGTHPFKWDGGDQDLPSSLSGTMRRLGGGGLSPREIDALGQYLMGLPAPRTPARDAKQVARGKAVFDGTGCNSCHGGALFTDLALHELDGALARTDTPSLIGLASSAPYYHDGSAATLEALLADRAAVHGMAETADLTSAQRADLIAYLETL